MFEKYENFCDWKNPHPMTCEQWREQVETHDLVSIDETYPCFIQNNIGYLIKKGLIDKNNAFLKRQAIGNGILFKREKRHPIYQACNRLLSGTRSQVETVFGVLKRSYGYRRVRYRSLAKNALQFTMLCICYNLRKVARA